MLVEGADRLVEDDRRQIAVGNRLVELGFVLEVIAAFLGAFGIFLEVNSKISAIIRMLGAGG